jgi:hypothetical protein
VLIQSIDNKNDLYTIKDIVSDELLHKLSQEILEAIPYQPMEWQEYLPRRKLSKLPGSVLSQIDEHINTQKDTIGKAINQTIEHIGTTFWFDQEGFTMGAHIDNPGVGKVMQIYLSDCEDAGTVFYDVSDDEIIIKDDAQKWHYDGPHPPLKIRKAFDFTENNGYIMINNQLQLHGVPHKLGKKQKRLSVYCYIS